MSRLAKSRRQPKGGHGLKRLGLPLLISSLLLLSSGCGAFQKPQSVLDPAGPVAGNQFHLMVLSIIVMTVVFAVVMGMLIWVLIRYRRRSGDDSDPVQEHGNMWIELTWTVIPLLILVFLAIPSVKSTWVLAQPPETSPRLHVTVIGHQFWWEFRYDDLGIVTANELRVPTGTVVDLTVESRDVIHSFWVPRLAGKIDAIPGRENRFWIEADEPGVYPGQCSQLCGPSHALMGMSVIAQKPEAFQGWVASMKKPFVAPGDPQARTGMDVFAKNCASCHTIAGTDFKGTLGPNLTGIGSRNGIGAETLTMDRANLVRWIADASAVKPGVAMPSGRYDLHLTDDQIRAVAAFLESQK